MLGRLNIVISLAPTSETYLTNRCWQGHGRSQGAVASRAVLADGRDHESLRLSTIESIRCGAISLIDAVSASSALWRARQVKMLPLQAAECRLAALPVATSKEASVVALCSGGQLRS